MKVTVLLFSIILHIAVYFALSFSTQNTTQGIMARQGKQVMTIASLQLIASPLSIEEAKPKVDKIDNNLPSKVKHLGKMTDASQATPLPSIPSSNSKALGEREKVVVNDTIPESQSDFAREAFELKLEEAEDVQEIAVDPPQENNEFVTNQKTESPQAAQKVSTKNNKVTEKPLNIDSQALSGRGEQGDNAEYADIGNNGDKKDAWDSYKASVFAAINAQKIYPKQARIRRTEGIVEVEFTIDASGNVRSYTLVKKVKSKHLNRSTQRLFAQLSLPKPASELRSYFPSTLIIPIKYSLN